MINQYIEVDTDFEAIHNWPNCNIKEVNFLRYPHRHKIYVSVRIKTNKDRQLEFFMVKKYVDNLIKKMYGYENIKHLKERSMETIGLELLEELKSKYNTEIIISVSEDNQVRGIVHYDP